MNVVFQLLSVVLFLLLVNSSKSSPVKLRDFVRSTTRSCHEYSKNETIGVNSSQIAASFWRHAYCKEPAVIRSAAASWPAFAKWTDNYLVESAAASSKFRVETGKTERRDQKEILTMPMADFMHGYRQNDWYLVGNVPDFYLKSGDIEVPWFLEGNCNSSETLKIDQFPAIILWVSSGGTKSQLHFDDLESVYCVLSGSKHVLLLNPIDGRESLDIDSIGLHSAIDIDNVDVEMYRQLASKPFLEAILQPGDCLYVPFHWFHQVDTPNERSIAVSFWYHPNNLDRVGCYPLFDQFSPLITKQVTSSLMKAMDAMEEFHSKETLLSEDTFLEITVPHFLPTDRSPAPEKVDELKNHIRSFFRKLVDLDRDTMASRKELLRISHSAIIGLFHLSRQLFDNVFFAQCASFDLPIHLESLDIATSHREEL